MALDSFNFFKIGYFFKVSAAFKKNALFGFIYFKTMKQHNLK